MAGARKTHGRRPDDLRLPQRSDAPGAAHSGGHRDRGREGVKKYEGDWTAQLRGIVVARPGGSETAFEVNVALKSETASKSAATLAAGSGTEGKPVAGETKHPGPKRPLPLMLLFAFLGGLILNIMPCVLPVIALKILGFVNQSKESPK